MPVNSVKIGLAGELPMPQPISVGAAGASDMGRHVVGRQAVGDFARMGTLIPCADIIPRNLTAARHGEYISTRPVAFGE